MNSGESLELQSDRIEMVLASRKTPARVTGGVITPRHVQFHIAPALGTKINKVKALTDEFSLALGVNNVRVSRQRGGVRIEIPRDNPVPVKLLALMEHLAKEASGEPHSEKKPIPLSTTVLGLCDDGAPLVIRLSSPDVAHVLISGTTGSGKTALCQTMILSLAMTHRRSQLQFVLVDPKRRSFTPFAPLPHLLRPIISDADEVGRTLFELVQLMETRRILASTQAEALASGQDTPNPRIVVVLDEFDDFVRETGQKALDSLDRLIYHGHEAGIHIILATSRNGTLTHARFKTRLIGKSVSPEDARVASGIGGTGAEKLAGRGDFVAVAAGRVLHFQAAYVSAAEMNQIVAQFNKTPKLRYTLERA